MKMKDLKVGDKFIGSTAAHVCKLVNPAHNIYEVVETLPGGWCKPGMQFTAGPEMPVHTQRPFKDLVPTSLFFYDSGLWYKVGGAAAGIGAALCIDSFGGCNGPGETKRLEPETLVTDLCLSYRSAKQLHEHVLQHCSPKTFGGVPVGGSFKHGSKTWVKLNSEFAWYKESATVIKLTPDTHVS